MAELLGIFGQGSTSPALARTAAGELFVLKFAGAGPGRRALLSEYIAIHLATRLGVRAPAARKLFLPHPFPWRIGTDEFDDLVQRSAGWNLGIAYIPEASDIIASELRELASEVLAPLALADRLLQNVDRTRANPNLLRDRDGGIWAIDYGACLFLERIVAGQAPASFSLPRNHFLAGTEFDATAAPPDMRTHSLGDGLAACVAEAPPAWLASLPFTPAELLRGLSAYVEAFSTADATKTRSEAPIPRKG